MQQTAESILLIDDDEDQLFTFKTLLEKTRLRVVVARSAGDARSLLDEHVRLVVCDVNLPRTSGKEFIKEVRSAKEGLPIISFSADSEYPPDEMISAGANAFCDKSRARELLRTVQSLLR